MKTPGDVGKDFDEYAREWESSRYKMEDAWDGREMAVLDDQQDQLQRPGDEWGGRQQLVELYGSLFGRLLPGTDPVNVLEIGAGGGRSTRAVLDVIGDRVEEYHIIDVSATFLKVLEDRIERPIAMHVVSDVDLSDLAAHHFQLCLAQSSWSHIGMYDQYRYLRDLRRVLDYQAPVVVNGQFLLGLGDDWTWNRFRRRVFQVEHGVEGVFHEFTGVGTLVEQLARLEYDIELIHDKGFIARRKQANSEASISHVAHPLSYPYVPLLMDYADGALPRSVSLSSV